MQRARQAVFLSVLVLPVLLPACQLKSPPRPYGESARSSTDVGRYQEAHRRSLILRRDLADLPRRFPQELLAEDVPSPWFLERLRVHKREYFAIRETLFEIGLLHAAAIVETPDGRGLRSIILRTSLSLLAGTDLVRNFRAVAPLLADNVALRTVWNEADPEYEIPEGSWEIALQAGRNAAYQDLFNEALERLKKYRPLLEAYADEGDGNFIALYPQGIEAALQEAEQSYALLRAGPGAAEDLDQDEKEVRELVARSKSLRAAWAASAPALREAIERDGGLIRGEVHVQILAMKREYLDLRERLYGLAFKHVAKLTRPDLPYPRALRLRAIGISLLAAVTLYENADHAQTHLLTIPKIRTLFNQGDPSLGIPPNFWDNVEREFVRVEYRRLLEAGIQTIERELPRPEDTSVAEGSFLAYVGTEVSASVAVAEMRRETFPAAIARALRYYAGRITSLETEILKEGTAQFSKGLGTVAGALGLGNLMGALEFRKGKLYDQPHWVRFLKERMEPGDLLLQKSSFRLTDKVIPGYFGHVAIYVGTTAELRQLGLLTHPWVAPHLPGVAAGKTIVEALPGGTRISTIEDFLNSDGVAILRPKRDKIPQADVLRAIALAFSHIGKKYDFRFDNNTWDTIVCSELAFHTYVNVRWTFAKVLSSYTITPDDVAVFAGSDAPRPFDLLTFIQDGRVVHDRQTGVLNEQPYIHVLGERYATAQR